MYIFPISKAGNKDDVQNYQPISRLNVLSKLFERLLEQKITLTLNNTLSNRQHGFQKSKLTVTNLLTFYTDLVSIVQKKGQVYAVYTDLRKAFDSVDYNILIHKLSYLGVANPMLPWFCSYLMGRKQQVKINNSISSLIGHLKGEPFIAYSI